jgi:hypothetical protein
MFTKERLIKRKLSVVLAAALLSGCAGGTLSDTEGAEDRANRLLERTISVLEKEKPSYQTNTEVISDGVAVPGLRTQSTEIADAAADPAWDLVKSIAFLRQAGKSVKLESDPDVPNGQTLTVEIAGTDWTELMKKDWEGRIVSMQAEADSAIRNQTSRLPGDKAVLMREELTASLQKARTKMEEMVGSMKADGVYVFKLQRGAARPELLIVENKLRYTSNGEVRDESIRTSYDFRRRAAVP